jgi:hypothetical protein
MTRPIRKGLGGRKVAPSVRAVIGWRLFRARVEWDEGWWRRPCGSRGLGGRTANPMRRQHIGLWINAVATAAIAGDWHMVQVHVRQCTQYGFR